MTASRLLATARPDKPIIVTALPGGAASIRRLRVVPIYQLAAPQPAEFDRAGGLETAFLPARVNAEGAGDTVVHSFVKVSNGAPHPSTFGDA